MAKSDDKSKGGGGGGGTDATKTTAKVSRLVKKGGVQPMTHTGLANATDWAADRFKRSVAYLTGIGLNAADAREMSLSALAHWAIETGDGDITTAGTHEYCNNVGGIHANDGEQYFESTDAGVKTKFAAYDTADAGVGDYWALLATKYQSCLKQLKDAPTSDAWIRCLGTSGYYGGSVDTMASGWKIRRDSYATSIHGDVEGEIIGDDMSRSFGPYTQDAINSILAKLHGAGVNMSGSNPWHLDPGQGGIKLTANYDGDSGMLTVHIDEKSFYVTTNMVWSKVASLMPAGDRVFGDELEGHESDENV